MIKTKSIVYVVVALLIAGLPMSVFANGAFANEVEIGVTRESNMVVSPIKDISISNSTAKGENLPEPDISRDEALTIAKKAIKDTFGLSVEDSKFKSNIENRKDWSSPGRYIWQMNWNYSDAAESLYINVTLDAMTGQILGIGKDETTYGESIKKTLVTKEEAQRKAEAFIEKIVPGLLEQTELRNSGDDYYRIMQGGRQPVHYNFNYIRLYDGVKYESNYINVRIDGSTGEITDFSYRWDEIKDLPSKEGAISKEKAVKLFKDHLDMELIYIPIRDQYKYEPVPKKVKLVYRAKYNNVHLLDAKTGKFVNWNGELQEDIIKTAELTKEEIEDVLKKAEPVTKNDIINKNRAERLAREIFKENIDGAVKINNISYVEGDSNWEAAGKKTWSIDFTVEKEKKSGDSEEGIMPRQNGKLVLDALTEELISFNHWDYYGPDQEEFEPALSWEEAYDQAIDMIAKYHPDKINDIKTEQVYYENNQYVEGKEMPPRDYNFNFVRTVNGALYEENSISIGFNNRTGKMQNFSCRWQEDMEFPPVGNVITGDEAKDTIFRYNQVELAYNRYNKTNDYRNPKFETMLVYRIEPKSPQFSVNMMLEARTGKPMDYNGNEIPVYDLDDFDSKVKNHWIEKKAKLLVQQGILDTNTFEPDEAITKIEAVKMLVKAKGMNQYYPMEREALDSSKTEFYDVSEDSDDYRYIQTAIRYGIIDNKEGVFNGSKLLSREELAVLLVKTLGYEELAKATEIFTLDYTDNKDITESMKGYVAIGKGLGLFRNKDTFRSKENATMGEAANMVYESLAFMDR